jgi:hypothetical protein
MRLIGAFATASAATAATFAHQRTAIPIGGPAAKIEPGRTNLGGPSGESKAVLIAQIKRTTADGAPLNDFEVMVWPLRKVRSGRGNPPKGCMSATGQRTSAK